MTQKQLNVYIWWFCFYQLIEWQIQTTADIWNKTIILLWQTHADISCWVWANQNRHLKPKHDLPLNLTKWSLLFIHTLMAEAAMQGANCLSAAIWVQYFAQGHFNIQLGEWGIQTRDLPVTRRPASWATAATCLVADKKQSESEDYREPV